MADKLDQLYDALKADGAVQNSRENFRSFFLAQGNEGYNNRKSLYDALKADGAVQSPTYEDFMQNFGWHAEKRPVQNSTQQAPASATPIEFAPLDTSPEVSLPSSMQNQARKQRYTDMSPEQIQADFKIGNMSRRVKGNSSPEEQVQIQKRMQQRMDEIEYEQETGNRLRQPVLNPSFEAPTITRDEYGNIRRDENGNIMTGFSTDEDIVGTHNQIKNIQEEWDSLSDEEKRERANQIEREIEDIDYKEPDFLGGSAKKLGAGFVNYGVGILKSMQELASGMYYEDPSSPTGYSRGPGFDPNANDAIARGLRSAGKYAERLSRQGEFRRDKGFTELLLDGDLSGFFLKGWGTGLESMPMTLSIFRPETMILNAVSMAGNNYWDETLNNPDIPAMKRFSYAAGNAVIEQLVEKYSDPFFKHFGGLRILNRAGREASGELAKKITKEATETIYKRILRGLGGVAKDAAGEGAEEIITNFGNDALGEALDLLSGEKDYGLRAQWEQLKKKNPNASLSDFAYQKATETMDAFWGGALAGAYMSGSAQLSAKGLQHALGRKISQEEIVNKPNSQIDPATMSVAQSYDDGYTAESADEMKSFNDEANAAAEILPQYGQEFAKMVTESDSPVETMYYLMENRDIFTDEQIEAANDYFQKKAAAVGMMEGALDRIDSQVDQANAEIRYNTHQQSNSVIKAQVADRPCYITGGDVVIDEATGMPILVGNGGAVVVRDAQTGETSVHSPQDVRITSMTNADEMMQYNETVLRQQLMQQADDDVTYGSPANEVYQLQDTVTLNDGEGNTITGEIVGMPNSIDGVYQVETNDTNKPMKYLTADELNRRIVAHNGMEVQRASSQPGTQTVENQSLEQIGTESVPTGNNQEQPQPQPSQGEEQTGGESSAENGIGANEAPATALSRIPVLQDEKGQPILNKKGKPQYQWHKASVEDAAAALVETTDGNMVMARDNANRLVKTAQAKLEKIRKQEPRGEDPIELAESSMAIQKQIDDTQATIKQWQDVAAAIQKQMNAESERLRQEAEAKKSEEQRQREAAEAEERKKKQDEIDRQRIREQIEKDKEKRNKEYAPLTKAKEEMKDDPDAMAILSDTEPRSLDEWVSSLLRPHSLLWQDASPTEVGLQSELGLKRSDMQRFMTLLGNKESNAEPFGKAVLDIYEALPEGLKNQYTDEDVRNTLLNLFNEGSSTRMMHLTEENRIDEARQTMLENLRRDAEAEMEAWAEANNLTPEERETYEDFLAQEMMQGAETEFINQLIEQDEQDTASKAMDSNPASRTAGREGEGGESQVQGQGATEAAGVNQEEQQPQQRAETPNGSTNVPDTNVSGGTQGRIAPSEQLKPTDLRDATRVESPELGVAEANAKARQAADNQLIPEDQRRILTNEEIDEILDALEDVAVPQKQIPYDKAKWDKLFKNPIKTPAGLVRMGEHQFSKLSPNEYQKQDRRGWIGQIYDTLVSPDLIVEQYDPEEGAERDYKYVFIKSFINSSGESITYFTSVTVKKGGMEVVLTSHFKKYKDIRNLLKKGKLCFSSISPSGMQTEANQPLPSATTSETDDSAGVSEGKDTKNINSFQEKSEKSSEIGATSSPEQIAAEEAKVDTNPTEAQKEAGNYQKGHIKVDGYDITIENPKGSIRRGVDANGKAWEQKMNNTYGYIRGTEATDGDHIDVFLSDNPTSGNVYVVDQVKPDGSFDEVKVLYGFGSLEEARKAYLSNYSKGWKGLGDITESSREEFKKWINSSHRKTKPYHEYAMVKREAEKQLSIPFDVQDQVSEALRAYEQYNNLLSEATEKEYRDKSDEYYNLQWDTLKKLDSMLRKLTDDQLNQLKEQHKDDLLYRHIMNEVRERQIAQELSDTFDEGIKDQGEIKGTAKTKQAKPEDYLDRLDEKRPAMNGVYYDPDGYAVVSDGFVLLADKQTYDNKHKGDTISVGKDGGKKVEGEYPDWKRLTAKGEDYLTAKIDVDKLLDFIAGAEEKMKAQWKNEKDNKQTKMSFKDWSGYAELFVRMPDGRVIMFRPSYLKLFAQGMKQIGANEISYLDIFNNVQAQSKNGTALVMPLAYYNDTSDKEGQRYFYDLSDGKARGKNTNVAENFSIFSNGSNDFEDNELSLPYGWQSLPTNDIDNEKTGQHTKGLKTLLNENYKEILKAYAKGRRDNRSLGILLQAREALRQELDSRHRRNKEWREVYNISKNGQISLNDLSRMFRDHNENKILGKLFEKVLKYAEQIGLDIRFDDYLNAAGSANHAGSIRYNSSYLASSGYNNQDIATLILHELIHAVTQSTVSAQKEGGKYAEQLTESQKKAAQEILDIYDRLKDWADKNGHSETYGFKNPHEMLAEMANPDFRRILETIKYKERKSLWEWLKDAFHGIFSLNREVDVEKRLADMLDNLIDNFRMETFEATKDMKENEHQRPIFISNAMTAVEAIKQEKATPDQWLAMLQKNGGLKAAEDKWIGLSDYLEEAKKEGKNPTKQEVMDYIRQNQIEIEDWNYEEFSYRHNDKLKEFNDEFRDLMAEGEEETGSVYTADHADWAFNQMKDKYGDDFEYAFDIQKNGDRWELIPALDWNDELSGEAKYYLGSENTINPTRMEYTTQGLDNKREIALVVPSIESYNSGDQIHFGDAGEGRAVAWIRFGDTKAPKREKIVKVVEDFEEPYKNSNGMLVYYPKGEKFTGKDYIVYGKSKDGKMVYVPIMNQEQIAAFDTFDKARNAMNEWYKSHNVGETQYDKVLVIDEIQSKRHQDAREKGYIDAGDSKKKIEEAHKAHNDWSNYLHTLNEKYSDASDVADLLDKATTEEREKYNELYNKLHVAEDIVNNNSGRVPVAPFEKNWHELAMKRMLRYAAENGYDKIAWTTGEQQAERYNIGGIVPNIDVTTNPGDEYFYKDLRFSANGNGCRICADENGKIKISEGLGDGVEGKSLGEVFGKDVAAQIMNTDKPRSRIQLEGKRIGGEGMKGFYDEILPRFMNKYGKKWGVKVDQIDLPDLEKSAQKMWSINVTPEMRESVMKGQPMFQKVSKADNDKTLMGVHNISEDKLKKALKQGGLANPSMAVFDTKNYAHTDYGEISLIPRSSLIDSRTGRNAGTYSGDAWTPTYPGVSRFLTKKGDKHRLQIAKEAANGDADMERHLAGVINDWIEGNGDRMHFLFLKQKGLNPEVRPERTTHTHEEFEEIQKIFGEGTVTMPSDFTKEQSDALLDLMTRGYEKQIRKQAEMIKDESKREAAINAMLKRKLDGLVDENGKIWFARGDSFVYDNWRDEQRRKNPQPDWYGTDNDASYRVAKEGLAEEYEKWKENLLSDEDIEEKLFAGWTPDGNKRYVANTVQNASRIMNKEADTNAYGNGGVNASKAGLLKKLKSLAEIRKYRHLLKNEDQIEEQQKQASDEWFDIISQVSDMQKVDSNPFINNDIAEARLQEAMTMRDPISFMNREYGYHIRKDSELASDLMNFIEKAKQMPVKYFETKFKRPVGIDEFAIAVVPTTTSPEVVKALKDAGLDVRTYEKGDTGDPKDSNRIKAVMDAVKEYDDILFHRTNGTPVAPNEIETALRDQLIDTMRNAGIEVITDDEEAQDVLEDINGKPIRQQKVYHGSGHDFLAFDHSHMGEGEGSQAFGWGTYVSTDKGVAEGYAKTAYLTQGSTAYANGKEVTKKTPTEPIEAAAKIYASNEFNSVDEAIDHTKRYIDIYSQFAEEYPEDRRSAARLVNYYKRALDYFENHGFEGIYADRHRNLFEVEIPDDTGTNYIDWKNPLGRQQLEAIKNGLMKDEDFRKIVENERRETEKQTGQEIDMSFDEWLRLRASITAHYGEANGRNLYNELERLFGSDEAASKKLNEYGFTGIKYPAGTILGGGNGATNYVIFNENDAKITNKTKFFRTKDGQAYGYTYNGKIYVDPSIATAETPVHEYTHLWAEALRQKDPDTWNQIVSVLKNDETVKPFWDKVARLYPELTDENDMTEEVLAQYSGQRGSEQLREVANEIQRETPGIFGKAQAVEALRRMKNILSKFWKAVADMMGWQFTNAQEIADKVLYDLLSGVNPKAEGSTKVMEQRVEDAETIDPEDAAMEMYNKSMQNEAKKWQEAWQDSMISLKSLQDAIAQQTGNEAKGAEDAYSFENRMHGRSKNMGEQFDWQYYQPMLKAFDDFCKAKDMTDEQAMDYLVAKHGLERNMYYAFRDAMKRKVAEEIKEEREKLEKAYALNRISEDTYKNGVADLRERELNGVDEAIAELQESEEYNRLKDDYQAGRISHSEFLKGNEELRREATIRKKPRMDQEGHIISDNYYDENATDYSGLTETFAKQPYDEAQKIKRKAQREIDPKTRKMLWQAYDVKMREAYALAKDEAENRIMNAEHEEIPKPASETASGRLWNAINAATKKTLQYSYESGMMDRKNYNKVRKMFDFYIPLRGWDENRASDVYSYVGRDNVFSPAVKKTWGRKSKADSPLAYIGNIAMSTIISGHHNQMKQHFLNYVLNNPTSLVSISESWYENIGTERNPMWILRSADTAGKSADEIAQIVNDFNEEMAQKQAEGKAIPVRGRLRLDVHATQGQKAEHVVEVQQAGRNYQMYINGDPRAAQALNGTLPKAVTRISNTAIGKELTKLNRNMAAFFTSKNPAFVVSNLSRDLNMAGASVAIKEGPAYNAQFIKNVAKVLAPRMGESSIWIPASKQPTGLMPSLMRKWKKGTLDTSNETERLFKEFMDEGGETGFVNMLSVDSFKEKMQKEIAQMHGSDLLGRGAKECSIKKGLRLMGETFEFYNRCAEDATRFIVYMTSRQMGKTLEESIADAKDVTLNFNRKGTGAKGNAEIRDLFIFVNPAIQALANMYKMATGRTLKFAGVTALFFAGGVIMPIINQWLLNMFGDDDDKEAYWNLPPWIRKNNLVFWIPFTKNFVTIPLAQEFRVFYGAGEMLTTALSNHQIDKPVFEILSSVADLVPINPMGNGGNLMIDLAPTGIQPLSQLAFNTDFTGKPIWRENQGNKHAPMYTKAYVTTPNLMIKISEKLNDWTGGNEGKKGLLDQWGGNYVNNPAVWNHLLQGYLGGMYNTIAKTADVVYTAASGEMPKVMQMPVINRFLNRPVERENAGVLGEDYYRLKEQRDALNYELRTFRKKAADGDEEAQKRVDEILSSDEWRQAEVFNHYEKIISDLRSGEQAATESADKGDIKKGIIDFKQQMMDDLNAIGDGSDPLEVAIKQMAKAKTFEERNRLRMRIERLTLRNQGVDKSKTKSRSEEVEKALRYITDAENESRDTDDNYLMLATPENVRDDARIKATKAKIKKHTDEFKRLIDSGAGEKAAEYRNSNLKWFRANDIINQQEQAMRNNKKLLGKGRDANIMQLIDQNRKQMLKAIEGFE